ncbi:MAG: hypothetical protein J2P27_02365 [Actinobacteria bacterium]|nr:hypothetical protein [Actinomycetota bacterium]
MHFRMPSSRTVTTTLRHLSSRPTRLKLGVTAASAAAVVSIGGGATAAEAATVGGTGPFAVSPACGSADVVKTGPFAVSATSVCKPAPAAQPAAPATEAAATQPVAPASPAVAPAAAPTPPPAPPAPPKPAAPPPPPRPYQIYDSVTPSAIPRSSQAVAVYSNGHYWTSPRQVGHRGLVLWIDTNGSNIRADVLDVEPGDATPLQAAGWVQRKLNAKPNSTAIIYTMRSEWGAVQAAVGRLAWWMPSHTKYWIADPTGVPHIVPGSQLTQWYWGRNFDISTAIPWF